MSPKSGEGHRSRESGESIQGPRSARTLILLLSLGTLLVAGFFSLGVWQVERRAWKLDLIERVETRAFQSPVAAPSSEQWPEIRRDADEYRRVTLTGVYQNDRETLVQAVTERGGGFWVLTPLQIADGSTVLINRGYVPTDKRMPDSRPAGQIEGPTEVTGLMRMSEVGGGFLRENDPAGDRWFSRDVALIGAARDLSRVAPYFIDADAVQLPDAPVGGLTVLRFNNNHLGYALTWFGLAGLVGLGMALLVRDELRLRGGSTRA